MTKKRLVFLLLVSGLWSLVSDVSWACPLCKEALFSPGEGQALSQAARAFNLSIVTLAAVPFLLVAGIAWLIVRSSRRVPHTILPHRFDLPERIASLKRPAAAHRSNPAKLVRGVPRNKPRSYATRMSGVES